MSRNQTIERILELWFDVDHCPFEMRHEKRQARDKFILNCVSGQHFTVEQTLDTLHSQYLDYRRERRKNERLAGGQQAPPTS